MIGSGFGKTAIQFNTVIWGTIRMMNLKTLGAAVTALVCASTLPAAAEVTFGEALKNGDVTLGFRLRYEEVNPEVGDTADLTSLRTRLTYTSALYHGWSAGIEVDDVTHLGNDDGLTAITDPDGTEVNQAYVAYTFGATTAKYGRQRILLDNQRFVGGVGFRQNEQTYDGFTVRNKSLADTELFLAYVYNVNRIFGEDDARGDNESDTWLLNARYSGFAAGSLTGYAYLLENEDIPSFSADTYGVRFAGATGKFGYALEYATQSDAYNNPANYTADYVLAEGSYQLGGVKVLAGYELLGADGREGQFITPLATLHKFQGWNDMFLGGGSGNIPGGIEDRYVTASSSVAGFNITVEYHSLVSDDSSASGMDKLGSEVGISLDKKYGPVLLGIKYSDYSADDFGSDSDKLWLTAEATF